MTLAAAPVDVIWAFDHVMFTPPAATERALPRAEGADACAAHQAWHYDDLAEPEHIHLCPAACDAARLGGDLTLRFGCAGLVLR